MAANGLYEKNQRFYRLRKAEAGFCRIADGRALLITECGPERRNYKRVWHIIRKLIKRGIAVKRDGKVYLVEGAPGSPFSPHSRG